MSAERKFALIIANGQYEDALLRRLVAPSQDAGSLAEVLKDPQICGFEVTSVVDEPSYRVRMEIERFAKKRERDELTLVYFSGHGITDDDGLLYFAARDTQREWLGSTGVPAGWVNEQMSRCRARRQVMLLDCCHAGAFARTKAAATVNLGQQLADAAREEGRGRFVITASDAFQYSFEGDSVEGQGVYSVFTKALVEGLRSGEADLDNDGSITLDELYRFVRQRVKEQTPQQSPRKWESDAEGTVVIAVNPRPAEAALPDDLVRLMENSVAEARQTAIPRLAVLLKGKHRGLALAAERALAVLAEDDSRKVSSAAQKCLDECQGPSSPIVVSTSAVPDAMPSVIRAQLSEASLPSCAPQAAPPPPAAPADQEDSPQPTATDFSTLRPVPPPRLERPRRKPKEPQVSGEAAPTSSLEQIPPPAVESVPAPPATATPVGRVVQRDVQPPVEIPGRATSEPLPGTPEPAVTFATAAPVKPASGGGHAGVEILAEEFAPTSIIEPDPAARLTTVMPQSTPPVPESAAVRVSDAAPVADSPSIAAESSVETQPASKRIVAKWRALPQWSQILIGSLAVGVAWWLREFVPHRLNHSGAFDLAKATEPFTGAVVGYVLAWALWLCIPQVGRAQGIRIAVAWCLCGLAEMMMTLRWFLHDVYWPLQDSLLGGRTLLGFVSTMFFLTLPEIAAGAFTGGVVAKAAGQRQRTGRVIGGGCVLVSAVIRWAVVVGLMGPYLVIGDELGIGLRLHLASWGAFTRGMVVPWSALFQGVIFAAGMLWLLLRGNLHTPTGIRATLADRGTASISSTHLSFPDTTLRAESAPGEDAEPLAVLRNWQSVPWLPQIVIVSVAMGTMWMTLWLADLNWSRGASIATQVVSALTTGALLGVALAGAVRFFVSQLDRKRQAAITLAWMLSALAGVMLRSEAWSDVWMHTFASFHTRFHSVWPLWVFTLMLPSILAGALTGMVLALSIGTSRRRGLVAGGLCLFGSNLLGPWSAVFLYGWGSTFYSCEDFFSYPYLYSVGACHTELSDLRIDWFDEHWVMASAMTFLEGAVAVALLLWLVRRARRSSS